MYDVILVPTDGSDIATAAAEHAFELARSVGATVHLLYVVDESVEKMLFSAHSMRTTLEEFRETGEAALDALVAEAEEMGVDAVPVLEHGLYVHAAIVEYAEDHDVDLIVMGTRGREGFEHFLGSTTERVLLASSIPVLAVSPHGVLDVPADAPASEREVGGGSEAGDGRAESETDEGRERASERGGDDSNDVTDG
ncbi:universal stress protein [Halomarina pelagica]|uniref:universal stress protein n=1 Tax=Halomarina pelagica TaxID=2961599 RepID=UPI0020C4B1F4|nr:universal stress protein [Halomarina sp. BND7]